MTRKNNTRHDVNASDEFDPSALSRGQLVQMVIDLRWRLDEHRVKADRERELVAIYRDTTEREREAVTHVNHQLLMQIMVLREAPRVIELGARETQVDTSPKVNQHPTTLIDLRFKLNKMHSKVSTLHGDPDNF